MKVSLSLTLLYINTSSGTLAILLCFLENVRNYFLFPLLSPALHSLRVRFIFAESFMGHKVAHKSDNCFVPFNVFWCNYSIYLVAFPKARIGINYSHKTRVMWEMGMGKKENNNKGFRGYFEIDCHTLKAMLLSLCWSSFSS